MRTWKRLTEQEAHAIVGPLDDRSRKLVVDLCRALVGERDCQKIRQRAHREWLRERQRNQQKRSYER